MSKVELHHSADATKDDVTYLLQQFQAQINWNTSDGATALDIGCGDGKTTAEAVKILIPKTMKLEACDLSQEALEFAKGRYGDQGITYLQWNATSDVPEGLIEKYDHVVSFYCFEYINNQRVALKNIYDILKPGGNCFIVQLPRHPFYECIRKLSKNPKWSSYLADAVQKCKVPLEKAEQPEKVFKDMMSDAGFQRLSVTKEKNCYALKSWDRLEDLATYADPYLDTLPFPMRREYIADYLMELQDLSGYVAEQFDKSGQITGLVCSNDVLIAYGEKET